MEMNYKKAPDQPLKEYGRNLNDEIAKGNIDPVIGREDEIKRIIEIISRKSKNNPVLIGEPGVGKTAIVEGLAGRIVTGDVPQNLKDKEIIELSLSQLIAGTKFRGEFEERLTNLVKQVKESNGQKILFIDEIHQLVGMGRSDSGAMDAANILKPMMARGEIKVIGATTMREYREYIEKDQALERRMQKIIVNEPTIQEALTIMRGLKERWEVFHRVKILDSALVAAVNLSARYIADKYLPDKAIDLIDEAAAKVKTEMNSTPRELDDISRKIAHLETERFSIQKETDDKSKKRTVAIDAELAELKVQKEDLAAKWNAERKEVEDITDLKADIEDNRMKFEKYQQEGLYEKASKIAYVVLPNLQKELEKRENAIKDNKLTTLKDSVTPNEVAEVLGRATGLPAAKMLETERIKLLGLKESLARDVRGQSKAVEAVANAVLRGRAGINDPNKPIGSFLFAGPTGVGKTELARSLARNLFDSEKAMVRLDMSEYMERHDISKMIGAPPGYVGYEQAGALTEAVRRKPYSIVLLDEIEKAHPDVLNILLQILDDGRITDSQGRVINFKNTIVIMTTNMGSDLINDGRINEAMTMVRKSLRPEFYNRIGEVVVFSQLSEAVIHEIAQKMVDELVERMAAQDIVIKFDKKIIDKIATEGYDPMYGARPLRRYIERNIENELANKIISGEIKKNKLFVFSEKVEEQAQKSRALKN